MSIAIESPFSFDGSIIKKEDLKDLSKYGYKFLGLVDTNTAFFFDFYNLIKNQGIKPLLGLRIKKNYFDIIFYPKNNDGYKELLKYKTEINLNKDFNDLLLSINIIYVIDVTYLDPINLKYALDLYDNIIKNNLVCYLGLNLSYYPCEVGIYPLIQSNYKCIILNKVKYFDKTKEKSSLILKKILSGEDLKENNLFSLNGTESFYLKPYSTLKEEYKNNIDLINNTIKFASSINLDIKPIEAIPKYTNKENLDSSIYLKLLSNEGLKRRLKGTSKNFKLYQDRLNYELKVIHDMGFDDYFLVVYDYILYSKKNDIIVGPGRGSSASSLVSYSLGIIDCDPIEHNLYFERFLNPFRKTMPDIDTDFEDTKRNKVIEYVKNKYGEYNVSLIGTYQTFLAKSALNEVAKALEIEPRFLSFVTKYIDDKHKELRPLLEKEDVLNAYNNNKTFKEIFDIAKDIESLPRSIGTHASGVLISSLDLREVSELTYSSVGFNETMYDSDTLKDFGLLKMDFLSLKNLSTLREIIESIKEFENIDIDLNKIPFDDKLTYNLLKNVNVSGIFQLESEGMRDLLRKIRIENFNDLVLSIALYRPGPRDQIPEYLRRRNNESKIDYYDPCLKDVLYETLGVIVYQEQLMAICKTYSGLSLAEADILRRAISSKDSELLLELKDKFYKGAESLNRNKLVTERLFNDIYKFGEYGFNKAHSVAYSFIAYKLAYLKAHYPKEFMISLLKSSTNTKYIKECAKNKIKVLPPDFRFSINKYNVVNDVIYMPFNAIKGIGNEYANILSTFKTIDVSFESVISKIKESVPRGIIESLILVGAFDYTNYNKRTMVESLDGLYEFDPSLIKGLNYKVKVLEEYDFEYLKNKEFDLIGFNYYYHPLKSFETTLPKLSDIEPSEKLVKIVGLVSNIKKIKTKNNDTMVRLIIEDEYIQVNAVMFSNDYYKYAHILKDNKIYNILGNFKENRGEKEFIIRGIEEI